MNILRRLQGRLNYVVPKLGLFRAARLGAAITYGGLKERLHPAAREKRRQYLAFDRRHNVRTAQRWYVSDMVDVDPTSRQNAIRYEPVLEQDLRRVIEALGIDHERFTFVDIGCGRGKALLVASNYPFRRIVGVEYDANLAQSCRENLGSYRNAAQRCHDIGVEHADATQYSFPDGPLVLYFFFPFYAPILSRVLDNLAKDVAASPREVYVIWVTLEEEEKKVLDAQPYLHFHRMLDEEVAIYRTEGS